jgi:hypothetical protein
MMATSFARFASRSLVVVVAVALGAAVFRVLDAPDRVQARRDTARNVCTAGGGEWVQIDREEFCRPSRSGRPKA